MGSSSSTPNTINYMTVWLIWWLSRYWPPVYRFYFVWAHVN